MKARRGKRSGVILPGWVRDWFAGLVEWVRGLVYSFFALFLDQVRADEVWVKTVRHAESGKAVVHVLRTVHLFDALCIHRLCVRNGLRHIGYVHGLEGWLYRPMRLVYRFMIGHRRDVDERAHLESVLEGDRSAILCLRQTPMTFHERGREIGSDVIGWLRDWSARTGRSVVLVPHAFVWGYGAGQSDTGVVDRIFGSSESPGLLRAVVQFATTLRSVTVGACQPMHLEDWKAGDTELRDELARTLDSARRIVTGPSIRSHYLTADLVMADPELRAELEHIANAEGRPLPKVRAAAEKELGKLMARPGTAAVDLLSVIFKRVLPVLYDGIDVDPPDLELVREASRKGPLIILPTHRSHIDYILLSWVFHNASLAIPLIAAGRNLSFFPLGTIFAGAGAFFIPRTLAGKDIERAVLRAYAHRILADGHHVEIFLEGTRSRSGKMLPLHTGLFEMLLEQARIMPGTEVNLLPVAICYERVIEEGHYAGEQAGGSKEPEGLGGLLRTTDFLSSGYGHLVMRLGTPLPLGDLDAGDPDPGSKRSIARLAYRMAWEMNRLEVLTPTGVLATALLDAPITGIDERTLFENVLFLLEMLEALGKPLATSLGQCAGLRPGSIGDEEDPLFTQFREVMYHAIHLLADDDIVSIKGHTGRGVYTVPWDRRLRLDYYRNGAVGPMAAAAIVCRVILALDDPGGVDSSAVRGEAKLLSSLLRNEFVFDARKTFDDNFDGTVEMLRVKGIADMDGQGRLRVLDRRSASIIASCVESVVETYRLVALVLADTANRKAPVASWEVQVRSFALHDRLYPQQQVLYPESRNRSAITLAMRALATMGMLEPSGPKHFTVPQASGARSLTDLAARLAPIWRGATVLES